MHRSATILLVLLALLALSPFAVMANATIVVNTVDDEDNTGTACSLREAITSANNNANFGGCLGVGSYGTDTITFDAGVFSTSQQITLASALPSITSRITITGPGSALLTLHGADSYQIFNINVGSTIPIVISDMTIAEASFAGNGGAIYLTNGKLTLNSLVFFSNQAVNNGGAVYLNAGSATVNSSSFDNNSSADRGGAIYANAGSTLRVSNSQFTYNHSGLGGAIASLSNATVVGGSYFFANSSADKAGAFYGQGAIFNSTFNENTADNIGGAIFNEEPAPAALKLIHVTIAGNSAVNNGDGVFMGAGSLSIMNSILSDNGDDCVISGTATVSVNYSLIESAGCGITNGLNGNIVSDAFFFPNALLNNGSNTLTFALSPASPAANKGSNNYQNEATVNVDYNGDGDKTDVLSVDQRGTGFARRVNSTVDMGAFEATTSFTGLVVDTFNDDNLYSCTSAADDCSLRGAINLANARAGNDTITFASSVFSGTQTITLNSALPSITSNLTITGTGSTLLDINGADDFRPFRIESPAVVSISGMKIRDGFTMDGGSAILLLGGSLSVSNVIFESNHSTSNGGAIRVGAANLSISNSRFVNNTSDSNGGAIFLEFDATLRVYNSSFDNNSADSWGGAIHSNVPVIIGGSSFYNNSAAYAGAVGTSGGTIFNSSFDSHSVGGEGGAINNNVTLGTLNLINVTITNSSAGLQGAGVYTGDNALLIANSIIANSSTGGDCATNSGTVTVRYSIIEDTSCGIVHGTFGNIVADPFLDADGLEDNGGLTQSISIAPGSPAVNGGSATYISENSMSVDFNGDGDLLDTISTDQRGTGYNRVLMGTVDIGAYESSGGFTGLVVDTVSDDDLHQCTSAANDCSLRGALRLANARLGTDTISFSTSVFSSAQTIVLTAPLPDLTENVDITGAGSNLLTLDGADTYRIFYVGNNATVNLSEIDFDAGHLVGVQGAAIFIQSGTVSISNSTFAENSGDMGGAIYIGSGTVTIHNVSFTDNEANDDGGAIYNFNGNLTVTESFFTGNAAQQGGAIYNENGTLSVEQSNFVNNDTSDDGGSIYNLAGNVTVDESGFSDGNVSDRGGAIYTQTAIRVTNSRFINNVANYAGGAIDGIATVGGSVFDGNSAQDVGGALSGQMTVFNSSFYDNAANIQGGAIYADTDSLQLYNVSIGSSSASTGGGIYAHSGTVTIVNSIIADSTSGGDCATDSGVFTVSYSLMEDGSCGIYNGSNNNIVAEALLDPAGVQNNGGSIPSLALAPASPAVNAGSNYYLSEAIANIDFNGDGDLFDDLENDQRGTGNNRTFGSAVDMGAFETTATFTGLVVDTSSDDTLYFCTSAANDCSLRGAISLANNLDGADSITFNSTVFATAQTITLTSDLPEITDELTITGTGANLLTIDGENNYRSFLITNSADFTLSSIRIHQNSNGGNGAALQFDGGNLRINDSYFSANMTFEDGVIYSNGVSARITNSTFYDNETDDGGAIYSAGGLLYISDSTFDSNIAHGNGGSVWNDSITAIFNSTFIGNEAAAGGAIYTDEELKVINVTIFGNNAPFAGGIYTATSELSIFNSIIYANSSEACYTSSSNPTINNSLFDATDCGLSNGVNGNLIAYHFFDQSGLQDNGGLTQTIAIAPLSPAVNAGNNSYLSEATVNVDFNGDGDTFDNLVTDQRGTGFNRVVNSTVDMGAFETTETFSGLVVDTSSDSMLYFCTSAANDCSLRGAMMLAEEIAGTDTISFDATVFANPQTITLSSGFMITDNLNIIGAGSNLVTISGDGQHRPFLIENQAVVSISGLTIADGYSTDFSGGIYLYDGTLSISNSHFSDNQTNGNGGAIYSTNDGLLTIASSSFSGNDSGGSGGAIWSNGDLKIFDSSFDDNQAANEGGAIYNSGYFFLRGGSFGSNNADNGGAISIHAESTIVNSSFYGNQASSNGGAIYTNDKLDLLHVTIYANAAVTGAGIYTDTNEVSMRNSVSTGNEGAPCYTTTTNPTILYSQLDGGGCGVTNGVDGNLTGSPLLDPDGLEDNGGLTATIAVSPLSITVNAGNNDYLVESNVSVDLNGDGDLDDTLGIEQRGPGFNRIVDTTVDMGAYESTGSFNGLVVDTTSDNTLIFCTSAANDCSLRGAITLANSIAGTDTIGFSSLFDTAQTITLTSDLPDITDSMFVTGSGASLLTIDGDEQHRPFRISNAAVVSISAMTIRDSREFSGAALNMSGGASVTLDNMNLSENTGTGNSGAIFVAGGTTLSVTNSSFNNNSGFRGGAIYSGGNLRVSNSSFSNNSATNTGGAIYTEANLSSYYISASSFSGNTATFGGAIGGKVTIFNSSFSSNSASNLGGSFYLGSSSATMRLIYVTVSGGSAPTGGAIYAEQGTLNVMNSIIANSSGGDCFDQSATVTINYSLIEDGSCGITNGVDGNLTGDPALAPFTNYGGTTRAFGLLPYSIAINAGNNTYLSEATVGVDFNNDGDTLDTLDTDQRGTGFNRINNSTVDMGAFEANPATSTLNIAPLRNYYTTNTPTLTWSRVSWATSYEIQISTSTGFGSLVCGGTQTYTGEGAIPGLTTCELPSGTYYWRVRAISASGTGAWSAVDVFVIGGP